MKRCTLLICAVLLGLGAAPALALKELVRMTPRNLAGQGFAVTASRLENGAVEFRVSRDLTKAQWQGRYATLEVRGGGSLLVKCQLQPDKQKNTLTYRFAIAEAQVGSSFLTLAEVQTDPKNADGEQLIGGGTIYEFHLAEYVEK